MVMFHRFLYVYQAGYLFFQMIFPMNSPLLRSELFQAAMHELLETRQRQQAVQFLGPEKVGEVAI